MPASNDPSTLAALRGVTTATVTTLLLKTGLRNVWIRGAVRDLAGVPTSGLPVWASGAAAPPSVAGLTFVDWQQPVGCGGVAILPDDVIVADGDGAVVVPAALVNEIAALAVEQERLEGRFMDEIRRGVALPGLYPPNAEHQAPYEERKRRP